MGSCSSDSFAAAFLSLEGDGKEMEGSNHQNTGVCTPIALQLLTLPHLNSHNNTLALSSVSFNLHNLTSAYSIAMLFVLFNDTKRQLQTKMVYL